MKKENGTHHRKVIAAEITAGTSTDNARDQTGLYERDGRVSKILISS